MDQSVGRLDLDRLCVRHDDGHGLVLCLWLAMDRSVVRKLVDLPDR